MLTGFKHHSWQSLREVWQDTPAFPEALETPSAENNFLHDLNNEERSQLFALCPTRLHQKGNFLFRAGDPLDELVLVLEGNIKITKLTEQGHERIIQIAGAGDVLAVGFLGNNATHACEAACLNEAVTLSVSREHFLHVMRTLPSVTLKLIHAVTTHMRFLEEQLSVAHAPVTLRIGQVLLHLTKRFGKQEKDDWWLLKHHLNQHELASLVGTSRVSITQQLGILREQGIVQGTRGRYRIRMKALDQLLENLVWEE
jgi:CRP/FNR family transcriptional regulator, cyclic AMP receptor protein